MTTTFDHVFIGQRERGRIYSVKLSRTVAEAVNGAPIVSDDDLVDWAQAHVDEILDAADRRRARLGAARGEWQELELIDFAAVE